MFSERSKGAAEIKVFSAFVDAAKLPYDLSTVEKRVPPEPDIICLHESEGLIAFELVEICDPNLAQFNATVKEGGGYYIQTGDPSPQVIRKKLGRKYRTVHPMELLCYTAGRVITPTNVIIPKIHPYLRSFRHGFRRAWLLSNGKVQEIWNVPK